MKLSRLLTKYLLLFFVAASFGGGTFFAAPPPREAHALAVLIKLLVCQCTKKDNKQCGCKDTDRAETILEDDHEEGNRDIILFIQEYFTAYRKWITNGFFTDHWLPHAKKMTEQLSAVGMQQAFIIGTMFDAKHQMETERLLRTLQAKAYEDYQPSNDFCWFGTNTRSLAHSEQLGRMNAQGLNARQRDRHLGSAINPSSGAAGAFDQQEDRRARWNQFIGAYCDPKDNNFVGGVTGLVLACGGGGKEDRINRDIDYTRVMEFERSLDVNFMNEGSTEDEEDLLALSSNLYGHDVLTRRIDENYIKYKEGQDLYMALRSVAAKRAVAENSFNTIAGLKSYGTTDTGKEGKQTRNFLGAIMVELGVSDPEEIYEVIGKNPSYYAQLEILAKRIYQNTDFYADLYDTPANVSRKSVALKAIELMLDRAIYESEIRQEMATSILLSTELNETHGKANNEVLNAGGG